MWQVKLDAFKARNRVIAIDIRGFGLSKNEQSVLSIDLLSDDLLSFINNNTSLKSIINY